MQPRTRTILIISIGVVIILIGALLWPRQRSTEPGRYDAFAACLLENGATFYGAYWCPHCKDQKELFGSSAEHLPYVECAVRGSREQAQACKDAGIAGYPTWKFADGETKTGTMSLEELGIKTGCVPPGD